MTTAQHIVILVHGIRTFGAWQDRLAALLHAHEPGVEVHVYKYGYLDALAFLIPGLRSTVIRRFRRYLTEHVARSRDARVDIVAHSFGTYVVAWALRRLPAAKRPSIHTVILCGSVLKQLFPWGDLVGSGLAIRRLVNECGTGDRWPVVAQLFVFGMGVSGRRGFAGVTGIDVGIVNRHFPVDHGGFFTDAFMNEHWIPLLTRSDPPLETHSVPPTPGWAAGLEYYADPAKLAFLLLPLLLLALWYQAQRANVAIAKENAARAEANAAMANESAARSDAKLAIEAAERAIAKEEAAQSKADTAIANEKAAQAQLATQTAEEKARSETRARGVEAERRAEAERREKVEGQLRLVASAYRLLYEDPGQAVLNAWAATQVDPTPDAQAAVRAAYKVAVLHHLNRREVSQITGRGPGYLAARWKQGDVFAKPSPDGRYRVMVTERGADGASPPGDVYLMKNEALTVTKIEPCSDREEQGLRVEDVAFDRMSRRLFVTRYYTLGVYDLEGRCLGKYHGSEHTKSPVHLVAGYLADRYLLAAETKGGLWAIHEGLDPAKTVELQKEFHPEVALAVNFSRSGRHAGIVFESGRAAFVTIGGDGRPVMHEVAKRDVRFAGFDARDEDMLITAGDDGVVRQWTLSASGARRAREYPVQGLGLEWVTVSDDGRRLLAVGTNHTLYVLDREGKRPVAALNYANEIDWAVARSRGDRPKEIRMDRVVVTPSEIRPFPDDQLSVEAVSQSGGETWILTSGSAYRVVGDRAIAYPGSGSVSSVERHGDLLWVKETSTSDVITGRVFRVNGDELQSLGKNFRASSILTDGGVSWIAATDGVYRVEGQRLFRLVHRALPKAVLSRIGHETWLTSYRGAYVIDGDRIIRVTDPFLKVRSVKVLRGRPWLLTGGGHVGIFADPDPPGPAFRVDHYLASPLGSPGVTNVFTTADREWLSTVKGLFVVDGFDTHKVEGIGAVGDVRAVGGHVWVYAGAGPLYRIDASRRRAIRSDITAAGPWRTVAGQTWIRYAIANDRYAIARLSGATIESADLDRANVRAMAEVDGTLWLTTDKGVWRESRGRFVRMSDLDVNAIVEVDGRAWLLGDAEVAAVDAAGPSRFPIRSGRPHRIKVIDGAMWVLTQRDFNRAGPAYRIDMAGAVPHSDGETGVADVVKIGTDTWLVTQLADGKPAPLRRVDH